MFVWTIIILGVLIIKYTIPELNEHYFDWQAWRAGCISETLKIPCREECIISGKDILRKHAIGWCDGLRLSCRARDAVAVLFFKDDYFWFHLRRKEFELVFGK